MKPIPLILIFIAGAVIAYFSKPPFPYPDGGKAVLRPELERLSER